MVGLLTFLAPYSQNKSASIPPEIYDSREFEILNKMSIHGDKQRYLQTLRTLKSPAVRMVKYYPDYVLKGSRQRNHRIYQRELWIYVISKHFKGRIIVFIDSEIDGFVYNNTDNEIDSVGVLGRDGFKLLKFRGEDDDNGLLIFKLDDQFYTVRTSVYLKFFELAKKKTSKPWIGFDEDPHSRDFEEVVPNIPEIPLETEESLEDLEGELPAELPEDNEVFDEDEFFFDGAPTDSFIENPETQNNQNQNPITPNNPSEDNNSEDPELDFDF